MSQVQVCSFCHLIQRGRTADHVELSGEDRRPYLAHLREDHSVILDQEISS